jgi:hypothetical protein
MIIKSTEGFLFGGFTPLSWKSSEDEIVEDKTMQTFVFTLTNPHGIPPTKYSLTNQNVTIRCDSFSGPIFGNCDIVVSNNGKQNEDSLILFPRSFSDRTRKGIQIFTSGMKEFGSVHFRVQEIEVFEVKQTFIFIQISQLCLKIFCSQNSYQQFDSKCISFIFLIS